MGQLLVAVKSCHRDRKAALHDAIRSTWGKDFGTSAVLRFFMGKNPDERDGTPLSKDEIVLDAPDDYLGLPHKTRSICQWALAKAIDSIFFCDNDTFVKPQKLMQLPFRELDYGGHFHKGKDEINTRFDYQDHAGTYPQSYPWCSGGMGYFLSQKAAREVAATYPTVWAEDMYVGQVMGPLIAKGELRADHLNINNVATWHLKKTKALPEMTPNILRRIYADGTPDKLYAEVKG